MIEDVDLIGADRDGPWQQTPSALNILLNAMDGLAPEARILFLLTTNRPEILEPALAARPGRIDQAIEIGLPEERERAILIGHYARGLALGAQSAGNLAKRLGRVSPAFIRELMRRAAQRMLERSASVLEDQDIETARAEMTPSRGARAVKAPGLARAPGFA